MLGSKKADQIWDRLTQIFHSEHADVETDFSYPTDLIWRSENLSFNYFFRTRNEMVSLSIQAKKNVWEAYMRFHENEIYKRPNRLFSLEEEEDEDGNYTGGPDLFYSTCVIQIKDFPNLEYWIEETQILIDISKGRSMEKYLV